VKKHDVADHLDIWHATHIQFRPLALVHIMPRIEPPAFLERVGTPGIGFQPRIAQPELEAFGHRVGCLARRRVPQNGLVRGESRSKFYGSATANHLGGVGRLVKGTRLRSLNLRNRSMDDASDSMP
jgi:hypothetical protein